MKKLGFAVALFSLAIFVTGCVTTLGHEVDMSAFAQIKKGVSTKEDVADLLGSPNQDIENEDGSETFVYTFSKVSHGIYGLGAGVDTQQATVKFNAKGIVIAKSKTIGDTGGTGIGGGGVK